MKILILVLAVASLAQCTLLKTLASTSRGFSTGGGYSGAQSQVSIEKAMEVQESDVFGNRAGPSNRYLPSSPTNNFPQTLPPQQNYIPPRQTYIPPPQPAPAHNSPAFSPPPSNSYIPPSAQSAPPPSTSYLPPQQNYLPPQTSASQGRGFFAPPQRPQNNYIPPPVYGPPQAQSAFNPQQYGPPPSNYLPPQEQFAPSSPPSSKYLPAQNYPEPNIPAPNYAAPPSQSYIPPNDLPSQPSGNYLPPQNNFFPDSSNQAGAFDSQSGYSYQNPFGGQGGFDGGASAFDARQSDRATGDYLPPDEPRQEPAPIDNLPAGPAESELSADIEGPAEHQEETPAPAPENVKTIKVITEPNSHSEHVKTIKVISENNSGSQGSVKTIRVITERRQPSAPAAHNDDVKVIRVIHENRNKQVSSDEGAKVLRVISNSNTISSAPSAAQVLRIINDAPITSSAADTSKVLRIISDGGSSSHSTISSGVGSSYLRILPNTLSTTLGGVSEYQTSSLGDSNDNILRYVSDSGTATTGTEIYGAAAPVSQEHVKILNVVGGASSVSSPSAVYRVLGAAPSAYTTNEIYSGYGQGSSSYPTFRVLQKRDSTNSHVSGGSITNRYAGSTKALRIQA